MSNSINLLLIDFNTPDKQFIIDNLLPNVKYIEINSLVESYSEIQTKIQNLNEQRFNNVSIIRVNDQQFFNLSIHNITSVDSEELSKEKFNNFRDFLLNLKNQYEMQYFDIITCNAYDTHWQQFITVFKNNYGLHIRTSANITGLNGDWILESDNINLVGLYFSENIINYKYSLEFNIAHTVVIDSNNTLLSCGKDFEYGFLGIEGVTEAPLLTQMTTTNIIGKTPIQVSYGTYHTVVLMSDGTIYSCGYDNGNGWLGIEGVNQAPILTQMTTTHIPSGIVPIQVSCGEKHTVVLMSDGTIYSCGIDSSRDGWLGIEGVYIARILTQMTTTNIPSGIVPIQVACGAFHTVVLMSDGTLFGCGYNAGQLSIEGVDEVPILTQMTTTNIPSGIVPIQVACGFQHTVVLMSDGTLFGCGKNNSNQLGIEGVYSVPILTQMTTTNIISKTPIQVSCGKTHTVVLMSDGTIYSCGYDDGNGWLGIEGVNHAPILTQITTTNIPSGIVPIQVACGINHTVVLMSNGTIYSCGQNNYKQLGIEGADLALILNQMTTTNTIIGLNTITKNPMLFNTDVSSVSILGGQTVTINGTNFNNNSVVKIDGSLVASTLVSSNQITFVTPIPNSYGYKSVTVTNDINTSNPVLLQYITEPISNICFPAGTPINTDQGIIPIEQINPNICTIRGNKIETITKTVTLDKYLVCIEKDAFSKNIPSQKTIISKNHSLLYNGKMVKAKELLDLNNEGIYKVKYNGSLLYNVLLKDKHDKMIVNDLICETLDPKNGIAKFYYYLKNSNYNFEEQEKRIQIYNNIALKNKTFNK
jgi:alpha-tubulin suppressor-like RCC1 family protein